MQKLRGEHLIGDGAVRPGEPVADGRRDERQQGGEENPAEVAADRAREIGFEEADDAGPRLARGGIDVGIAAPQQVVEEGHPQRVGLVRAVEGELRRRPPIQLAEFDNLVGFQPVKSL
ncbi:MAG: hypothetical protein BWY76_01603 [bacterium ADurb.Bin429]|nr:MAG: hypothetical protein BWY76_01603 [bacterium ADurb.Bin429]